MNHPWADIAGMDSSWFYWSVCDKCGKRNHLLKGAWYNGGAYCRGCRMKLPRPEIKRAIQEWKFADEVDI